MPAGSHPFRVLDPFKWALEVARMTELAKGGNTLVSAQGEVRGLLFGRHVGLRTSGLRRERHDLWDRPEGAERRAFPLLQQPGRT